MSKDPRFEKLESFIDRFGNIAVESFHYIALFIIGCMVIWSAGHTVIDILTVKQYATIDDILLLFIYLELGAMVGIFQNQPYASAFSYLYCNHCPNSPFDL